MTVQFVIFVCDKPVRVQVFKTKKISQKQGVVLPYCMATKTNLVFFLIKSGSNNFLILAIMLFCQWALDGLVEMAIPTRAYDIS